MIKQGGHLLARSLKNENVECIFTLCGGHIQPTYTGCREAGIKVVDVRHEQAATHAADGWARITRNPGVAIVTAGPGLTNSVTGIANAMRAGSPIVVIGGQAPIFQFEKGGLQEMNHIDLLKPVTKWAKRVHETRRIPEYVGAAFREATAGRPGPVFLEIPLDVLMSTENDDTVRYPANSQTKARLQGDPAYIEKAAELLAAARQPVIMAGSAIWWDDSGENVEKLSALLDAPIYVNGMARGCISSANPRHLSHSRGKALGETDTLLLVGAEFDFRLGYGDSTAINGAASIIQIHIDPAEIGRNRHVDVGLVGNTQSILQQLCDAMEQTGPPPNHDAWLKSLRDKDSRKIEKMLPYAKSEQTPIHPARLCREIDEFLDDDAIIIGDGGDIVSIGAQMIRPRAPGQWLDPGPFGCLGMGVPFGLAAALAKPGKQLLLLYGDGSFGFNGMEMDTAVRFNLPMVVVIGNDGGWGQMRLDAQAMGLNEQDVAATELGFTHYEKVVEAFGGVGEYVEEPSGIRPALERAFGCGRPACINVKVDPMGARQMLQAARGMTP